MEKGRLLYIEKWSMKRKYFNDREFIWAVTLIGIGILLMLFGIGILLLLVPVKGEPVIAGAVLLAIDTFLLILAVSIFKPAARMPFTMYQNGFPDPWVPFRHCWSRHECFIPWKDIVIIQLAKGLVQLQFLGGDMKIEMYVHQITRDPLQRFSSLRSVVPDLLSEELKSIDRHWEKPFPLAGESIPILNSTIVHILLMTIGFIFTLLSTIAFISLGSFGGVLFCVYFMCLFIYSIHWDVWNADRIVQNQLILNSASMSPYGILFPQTFIGREFFHIQPPVLWMKIKSVGKTLEPCFLSTIGEVFTFSGERYLVPISVYKAMKGVPFFSEVRGCFQNRLAVHDTSFVDPRNRE